MQPWEIGAAGERIVADTLRISGFVVTVNTQLPGATDIDATKVGDHRLVQVKTSVAPEPPAALSPEEVRAIKSRASRLGATAWQARLMITPGGLPGSAIEWQQL